MNKLVIVGNGFDLAHGLPTSYKDFIDSFWQNLKINYQDELVQKVLFINPKYNSCLDGDYKNFKEFQENLQAYANEYSYRYEDNSYDCYTDNTRVNPICRFNSDLFRRINIKSMQNWVDIENEYYSLLKINLKNTSVKANAVKDQVLKLNAEFEDIKKLLADYLKQKIKPEIDHMDKLKISNTFFDFFDMDFLKETKSADKIEVQKYLSEFSKEEWPSLLKYQRNFKSYNTDIGQGRRALEQLSLIKFDTIFLNFNYTDTTSRYSEVLNELYYCKSSEIKIHGELESQQNRINFGFGDEMDEDYKFIENLNENEYLENFKSFKYSQNSNYKNLLDYIDSAKFQVYIMGHSCGLSDRTLLNTIFEHQNCRSIKVFYHQRKDGKDNYTEIIQNISRHFNDKQEMRAKLVNKSLCSPLPQNTRFQKKQG